MSIDQDFAQFVDARWSSLYKLAYLLVASPTGAEDLLQTTLEKAHVNWARMEHGATGVTSEKHHTIYAGLRSSRPTPSPAARPAASTTTGSRAVGSPPPRRKPWAQPWERDTRPAERHDHLHRSWQVHLRRRTAHRHLDPLRRRVGGQSASPGSESGSHRCNAAGASDERP
jgi:hypothetical protein